MPKVLIADELSPKALEVFAARGVEAESKVGLKPAELLAVIGGYDGLAVRSMTRVTGEVLKAAKRLKVVGRAGIGVDNVDVKAATAAGVAVMNTPFGNATTTAEHALALMLALAREIPAADTSTRAGEWAKSRFMGVELAGKTLGIIGCGNIGSIVADRAQGLKMKVVAYDPYLSPERAKELGVERLDLDTLFRRADVITLHVPLTADTKHMIDASALARMRPGVRIVNCARGGLIDEVALAAALTSGQVKGAALDVFETEPAKASPLFALPGVICTPHLGASTNEAQEAVAIQIAEQIADFLLTGAVVNAVNLPAVSAEEAPRLRPYMALAEQLGSFAGQLTESGLTAVSIEFEGLAARLNRRPIIAAALKGLLEPQLQGVNMVNAPALAHERGIAVSETAHDRPCDYQSLIRLTVTTEKQTRSVAGTLFAGDKPRVVNVKGIPLEASLAGRMLYISNEDKPGLIGHLGSLLGEAGVNIASFHLGRLKVGGDAIALVEIDQDPSDDLLRRIRALPHVMQEKVLRFF
ncbi:MAG: phosphoglycerate dehydrogenase [Alphaproteobacteria bacterium]|nr:phosphoglycerate dehydrogenase [Alphaproteobacteria bacterium]